MLGRVWKIPERGFFKGMAVQILLFLRDPAALGADFHKDNKKH